MYKRFFIKFLSLFLTAILILGGFVFAIDPFNHYRAEEDLTKIIYQMPYYQNIGIASYTKYDTLITGSSMTQNFRANLFDKAMNCHAIRLSFDGGIVDDYCKLIETSTQDNPQLKQIFFGLDNYLITSDSKLLNEIDRIPLYLSDNNILNDVQYLLNKDVVFNYIRTYFAYKFSNTYDFYEMHAWDNGSVHFSAQSVLANYSSPQKSAPHNEFAFQSSAQYIIDKLSTYIKNYPEIDFILFAPPYSILYWHSILNEGKLNATIEALRLTYCELLKFDNVRIFYFQNIPELITNLDNYNDATHYRSTYNEYMLDCFVNGENEITKDNYVAVLEDMKQLAISYDYDTLLNN